MAKLVNPRNISQKSPICRTFVYPTCHTCQSSIIDKPYRFLVVQKPDNTHELISFHYFFPCWDIDFVCKNLLKFKIVKAGFICDQSIKKNPKMIKNLKKNIDLWDV